MIKIDRVFVRMGGGAEYILLSAGATTAQLTINVAEPSPIGGSFRATLEPTVARLEFEGPIRVIRLERKGLRGWWHWLKWHV